MEWYWIVLLIAGVLVLIALALGYAFFRYLCDDNRKAGENLDNGEGRALKAYVPVIKSKAKQIAAYKHEVVSTKSFDGLTLRAKLYPNKKNGRIVILVHGYHSSSAWDFGASFEMYYREGYTILAVDDRAHGGSEGKYIGFGALDQRDVRSWMDWTVQRFGKDCRIAIIGVSMGAATVMLTTGNYPIPQLACAIEDCGYTSISDVVDYLIRLRHVPAFPLRQLASLWSKWLAGYWFSETSAEEAVKQSHTPTLFIHGTADKFVEFYMLDRVYNACAAPKQKVVFEDAVHGESSYKYPERFEKTVIPFLQTYMS